jgi:hypothetical protein
MARTPGNDAGSSPTAKSGQRRPTHEQRVPESEAAGIVLTPEGQRRLAARAVWLATERSLSSRTTWMTPTRTGGLAGSTGVL